MAIKSIRSLIVLGCIAFSSLHGATLELKDGSQLMGSLDKIHDGKVYFKTSFAGTLEISQSDVMSLRSDESVYLRTQSGEVFSGPVQATGDGTLVVKTQGGQVTTAMDSLSSGWAPGGEDPITVARTEALENKLRTWKFEAGADLSSRTGNTEKSNIAIAVSATLEGPTDRLRIYGSYKTTETESVKTEDETIAGVRYTNFFTEHMGWYVRQEIELDDFEGIEFRSTSGIGLTYRFFKTKKSSLETSAGFSYRYDSYTNGLEEGYPGLDFGLTYYRNLTEWADLNINMTYIPSINDFGDYLLTQTTAVDMPLGTSNMWKLRLGVENQFNSEPEPGREELDSYLFARLLLSWE